MPHFYLKLAMKQPALLRLPDEILEEIVSELGQHMDLVAFALASRLCAALVVPHHTQYRILRVRHTLPYMWAHLARRADLARNVREVHICERTNIWAPDHYPTTLIDKQLDEDFDNAEESVRIRNICQALSHMRRLKVFTWSWSNVQGQQRPTSNPRHENDILKVVVNLPKLEQFSLNGNFALHALNSVQDPYGLTYPVWKLSNLRSLSLVGESWAKLGNSKHLCRLFANSPNLEHLEVPLEFYHLAECRLPKLKKLKMKLQAGAANIGIDRSRVRFLENHPSIEELDWSPIGMPNIASGSLPNLKALRSNRQFIMAVNDPEIGIYSASLMTPPSTPVAALTPVPEEPTEHIPVPPPVTLRPIENLDIFSLNAQTLLDLRCLDPQSLRRLKLHTFGDISTLYDIAQTFPNIEWLSLPTIHLPTGAVHPIPLSRENWLDILPRFTKLYTFRGLGLWACVKNDMDAVHDIILHLVQTCLQLRVLDRADKFGELDLRKQVVIERKGEDGRDINYGLVKMPPRKPFDIMDGIFD